jgi:hypothetical protein
MKMRPRNEAANSILIPEKEIAKYRSEKEPAYEQQAGYQHHRIHENFEKGHGVKYP